jgi:hypothetical protein
VHVLVVRRAPIVDETELVLFHADGVDDELAVLVAADGFRRSMTA